MPTAAASVRPRWLAMIVMMRKRDLNEAVLQRCTGRPMRRICPMTARLRAEIRLLQRASRRFLRMASRAMHDAEGLRERRAEGGAGGAEAQRAHEQIVQRDVRRAGDGDEVHRALAVAHAAEDGAEDVIGRDERDAEEADGQIGGRAGNGLGGRGHDGRDGPDQQEQDRRQHQRKAAVKSVTVLPVARQTASLGLPRRRPARWRPWCPWRGRRA